MIKTKKKFLLALFVVVFAVTSLFIFVSKSNTAKAYAAETKLYTVPFSYTLYNGIYASTATIVKQSESNVYESARLQCDDNMYQNLHFQIYGTSYAGTANYTSSDYVGSTINITTNSWFTTHEYTVKNSAGTVIKTATTSSFSVSSLSTGTYTVDYIGTSEWKEDGNIRDHPRALKVVCNFQFKVDTTAPTISGASTSTTGKYTNSAFTVTANDSASGISVLYWKDPLSTSYSAITTSSKTIAAGSTNGLYRFYAVDKTGNASSTYYVYYDNVAPTGKVTTGSGVTVANGGSINESFSYTATDSGSGISSITYTTPSSSVWKTYTSGTTIDKSAGYGAYSFKATDKAGNSEIYTVTLADPCADGHDYIPKVILPTCTTGGYTIYTCSCCGDNYTTDKTSALGHSYTAKVTSSTCTSGGYTTYTCTKCSYSYTGNTTSALGHSYKAVTTSSSCTVGGYTTYKCTRCGISYTDSPTQATGHSYVASITEATCTERGYTVFTCTKCGDTYRDNETAPLGHNYISEFISASCTDGGYTLYTCTRCGESYKSGYTQPTGHNYVTTTIAANCTEGGYTLHTCSICGESYKDNVTQPLGHNFISSTREATCTQFGGTVYTCQVCGYEYSDNNGTYPKGHNYSTLIITEPTCTTEGLRRSVCDDCGDTYDTVIPANGHSYIISDVISENGITTRTYTCTVCGETYKQELGDQYEEVSNYVEYLFEQYSPYMWWVLLAAAGVWSIVMGVFFAIAQKNEDKEKAKKMIINYIIGLVVIAVIVVACPYLIRGIAALVT